MAEAKFKLKQKVRGTGIRGEIIGIINAEPERIYFIRQDRNDVRVFCPESELMELPADVM
jgi:hypothetical protein